MSAANGDLKATAVPALDDVSRDHQPNRDEPASRAAGSKPGWTDQSHHNRRPATKSIKICRYYATKKGCRAGDSCVYQHVDPHIPVTDQRRLEGDAGSVNVLSDSGGVPTTTLTHSTTQTPKHVRHPVAKPVTSLQKTNPREFQIGQVVRRFAPTRKDAENGTTVLGLTLHPSDPDFPFELAGLKCLLSVPHDWPTGTLKPSIKVENSEIPRGYQINIEQGFLSLVHSNKTLLALLNDLDKKLELFLSSEKAQTIKIVANRRLVEAPASVQPPSPSPTPNIVTQIVAPAQPSWTQAQKAEARVRRDADIGQLEARMGRLPLFSATDSPSGSAFNVPIQVPKPMRLPVSLQSLKEVILTVPQLYNLEVCTVKLKGVNSIEARNVETSFGRHAKSHTDLSLMAHINHLTHHMHEMVTEQKSPDPVPLAPVINQDPPEPQEKKSDTEESGIVDEDRPHLVFLARPPPEWSRSDQDQQDSGTESEEDESDYTGESDTEDIGGATVPAPIISSTLEKGILISFPNLEMTGTELLELRNLSLSVRCDRCKTSLEIKNIKPADPNTGSSVIRTESCTKCASPVNASYRAEPMHANSIKAGHLDLEGCTVLDMLPSTFIATCSECSTTQSPYPGITTVRGDTALEICRECHHKMTIKIAEVKFLRVSLNDNPNRPLPPRRKKIKEELGITTGTELPLRGRCKHYSKSFRWFRFSCCDRVYPCDRCHDADEQHPNEHANRMICGFCSREQNYRPDDCSSCGRSVIRKSGGGFWEGGKGTRDKTRMNRNDPRKYKRVGGGAVAAAAKEKKK